MDKNASEKIDAMSSDDFSKMILEHLGLSIQKLEEPGDRKEADFLAHYDKETFLIEAKLKGDNEKEVAKRENVLSQGEVYEKDDVLGRDGTISGVLSNARDQLISSAKIHGHDLRVVVHLSKGINAKAKHEKAIDTLLGRTQIIDMTCATYKPCYFFRYSDFFTHRYAFDAAIVGYMDACYQLHLVSYINPHSPRYEKAVQSKFFKNIGVRDPKVEEEQGEAYIPDADVSIKDPQEVMKHLCAKYSNKLLQQFDFNAPEIAVRAKVKQN